MTSRHEHITNQTEQALSQVTIEISREQFSTTGLMILERNWFEIYRYEHWNGMNIPRFEEGQTFAPKSLMMTVCRDCGVCHSHC